MSTPEKTHLFTSESVTEGHPDKLCDLIANRILDEHLLQDPNARVACEALANGDLLVIGGEITSNAIVDAETVAREAILSVGYNNKDIGFDGNSCRVIVNLEQQSKEIASGVFNALEGRDKNKQILGAGDQGIIFGYAVADNDDAFPVAGKLSHLLAEKLSTVRRENSTALLPDAKTQVTIKYVNGVPESIDKVLISTQHTPDISQEELAQFLSEQIIEPTLKEYQQEHYGPLLANSGDYLINPAGPWSVGGPKSDAGLVGRKIIVDSYTGYARHGGGNYNGKDATKVDRSAAYALRWVAKNFIAAGLAEELEIQVAYAIGSAEPVSIFVDTKGRKSVGANVIEGMITEHFDLTPAGIIESLDLLAPRYTATSAYGHFGRNPRGLFTWENTDKAEQLKKIGNI